MDSHVAMGQSFGLGGKRFLIAAALVMLVGCASPEDGRPRGGGPGGDARNVPPGGVHAPSTIDGTRTWTARPKT